jgi:hypothetical protein
MSEVQYRTNFSFLAAFRFAKQTSLCFELDYGKESFSNQSF